jgi:predicted esterase
VRSQLAVGLVSLAALSSSACLSSAPVTKAAEAAPSAPSPAASSEQRNVTSASPRRARGEPAAQDGEAEAPGAARVELRRLAVPGFLDAVVALPEARTGLTLLVATHGAGGAPEGTCWSWLERSLGRALVVCPRGRSISADSASYYYPDHHQLEAEVRATLEAARREFCPLLASGPALYAGYSQGATMGALFIAQRAEPFSTLILTEGGYSEWTQASARRFRAAGGERVVFVCGTAHCARKAAESAALLQRAEVATAVESVNGGGHTDGGTVGVRLDSIASSLFERGRETPTEDQKTQMGKALSVCP